jgi:glycosyltransferase involved in cell wall biosynthesis
MANQAYKKILHIQVIPKLSGVQRVSLEILKHLSNEKYEKYILWGNDDIDDAVKFQCKEEFEKIGVKVLFTRNLYRAIGLKDILAFIEIYKLCKKERFDIVHTNSTKPGIIGRIAATLARIPVVIHTVHGLAFHKYVKFPIWQFYWICEMIASFFCTKIVLVNTYYSKYFKYFGSKLLTIYNGIDFSIYQNSKNNNTINEKVKILFVGRLDTQKDPLTLLRAAKEVLKEEPDTHFSLVGDGEKREECEMFIQNNHLGNNVFLEGWQYDVAKYYETHHIFMNSSIYEAFGIIFIEAGYHKLPIAATNVEGIPEVIEDKVTGLLSPPRDPHKLAQNVLYLIRNEKQRKLMGENGYRRVISLFNAMQMAEKYENLYNNEM